MIKIKCKNNEFLLVYLKKIRNFAPAINSFSEYKN